MWWIICIQDSHIKQTLVQLLYTVWLTESYWRCSLKIFFFDIVCAERTDLLWNVKDGKQLKQNIRDEETKRWEMKKERNQRKWSHFSIILTLTLLSLSILYVCLVQQTNQEQKYTTFIFHCSSFTSFLVDHQLCCSMTLW